MHIYEATISWDCDGDFAKGRYSRAHDWAFDGGAVVRGSSSPLVVPIPFSDPSAIDPEEAFVAAVSSCHMMWFLDLARQGGWSVSRYRDCAKGQMNTADPPWIERIDLYPVVYWDGSSPDDTTIAKIHADAHRHCFIANSIKSAVFIN